MKRQLSKSAAAFLYGALCFTESRVVKPISGPETRYTVGTTYEGGAV